MKLYTWQITFSSIIFFVCLGVIIALRSIINALTDGYYGYSGYPLSATNFTISTLFIITLVIVYLILIIFFTYNKTKGVTVNV